MAVGIALAISLLAQSGCKSRGPADALVASAAGEVSVQVGDDKSPGAPGMSLYESDIVATGDKSSAGVSFEGGGVMSLGPNSALIIRRASATAAHLGAVLLQGSVKATGKAGGARFTLGTPFGYAELGGDADTEVSFSKEEGLRVLLGAIEIIDSDGKRTRIEKDGGLDAEGRLLAKKPLAAPVAMSIVLTANPAQVKVRGKDDADWRKAERKEELQGGEAIRTRKTTSTSLDVGEHGRVALQANSELKVIDAVALEGEDKARYELLGGGAVFGLERQEGVAASHEVKLASQQVTIEPGLAAAKVAVQATADGGVVTVRQGRARLASGDVIEPGYTLNIGRDGASELVPLASTKVELRAGTNAVVQHDGAIPALKLTFASDDISPPYEVQIATDRDFAKLVWHEQLSRPELVTDELGNGQYFWRVRVGDSWRAGSFGIERGRENECQNCKRQNIIDETGENTVVYFQKTLPAITMRWPKVEGAEKYRIKLFQSDAVDKPLIDEALAETTFTLAPGRLSEDSYVWLVQALAQDGKELTQGRINALNITYDNAVVDLRIRTPARKATVKTASIVSSGEVRLGSRLWINGAAVALDKKGRFRESIKLATGTNQITYKTSSGGVERFYLRQVTRK